MIYEDNTLKRILVDGGYIEDGRYHFYVQDHLGNNRMVVDQEEGEVTRKNHRGIKYRTVGPTSTKGVYELEEIVVTPNENEKNNIIENTWDSMYPWSTDFMRK